MMEMKKNNDFVLRRIADSSVLVPFGSKAINFNGVITLNDSAEFLWKNISDVFTIEDIVKLILDSYDNVTEEIALTNAQRFVDSLKEAGAIE